MLKRSLSIILFTLLVLLPLATISPDTLLLTNGNQINGKIISQKENSVRIRSENRELEIRRNEIQEIIYSEETPPKMTTTTRELKSETGALPANSKKITMEENPFHQEKPASLSPEAIFSNTVYEPLAVSFGNNFSKIIGLNNISPSSSRLSRSEKWELAIKYQNDLYLVQASHRRTKLTPLTESSNGYTVSGNKFFSNINIPPKPETTEREENLSAGKIFDFFSVQITPTLGYRKVFYQNNSHSLFISSPVSIMPVSSRTSMQHSGWSLRLDLNYDATEQISLGFNIAGAYSKGAMNITSLSVSYDATYGMIPGYADFQINLAAQMFEMGCSLFYRYDKTTLFLHPFYRLTRARAIQYQESDLFDPGSFFLIKYLTENHLYGEEKEQGFRFGISHDFSL